MDYMERELFDLILRIMAVIFLVGAALFAAALVLLRIGRKGSYWRLRRRAAQNGGRLLILSVALWMVAAVVTSFTVLATTAIQGAQPQRGADDLYGIILTTPTAVPTEASMSLPTPTLTPLRLPARRVTPPFDELLYSLESREGHFSP
jgi:hypothetical protein